MAAFTLFHQILTKKTDVWIDGVYRTFLDSHSSTLIRVSVLPGQGVPAVEDRAFRGRVLRYKTVVTARIDLISGDYVPSLVPFKNVFSNDSIYLSCDLGSGYGAPPRHALFLDRVVIEVRWWDDAWASLCTPSKLKS